MEFNIGFVLTLGLKIGVKMDSLKLKKNKLQ